MQNKRQIFNRLYFPGLISLVFLPFLCIGYLYIDKIQKFYRMEVVWGNDKSVKKWSLGTDFNYKTYRKYKNIDLVGDEETDRDALKKLQQSLKVWVNKVDIINGYSVTFTRQTKYKDIVQALDICTHMDPEKLGIVTLKNQIFVWQTGRINKHYDSNTMFCGTSDIIKLSGDVIELKEEKSISSIVTDLKGQFLYSKVRSLAFFAAITVLAIMVILTITGKRKYILFSGKQ